MSGIPYDMNILYDEHLPRGYMFVLAVKYLDRHKCLPEGVKR